MISNGTKEITLLGQNVNAYNNNGNGLSNLILELEKLNGLERIRYMTSHPKDMSDDLLEVYKNSKKLMPLVHLPVQSGSDKILELMNRKHTIKDYLDIFYRLKKINSRIEFSSDFIISYPGEDENDFQQTLKLIKEVKFINSFSFIFSPRPGTVASKLPIIDREISLKRLKNIQQILFQNQTIKNKSQEHKIVNVLVENKTKEKNQLFGRSEFLTPVFFYGTEDLIGKTVQIKVFNSNHNSLFGNMIKKTSRKVA